MNQVSTPQLVVTLVLFTTIDPEQANELRSPLVSLGEEPEPIGTGLFVVTRRANQLSVESDSSTSGRRVLPAALVKKGERLEESANRVLAEELGFEQPVKLRQSWIYDDPLRDASGAYVSITYWGFVAFEDLAPLLGGRDQVGLELVTSNSFIDRWADVFGLEEYDGVSRFGFRYAPSSRRGHEKVLTTQLPGAQRILDIDYDEMVFYSWRKLRHGFGGRLDPFRFLGTKALKDRFRLSDLRDLSDVCRGERSQVDQFRRYISSEKSFVAETDQRDSSRPGKPAVLYELKDWADPENENSTPKSDDESGFELKVMMSAPLMSSLKTTKGRKSKGKDELFEP